MNQLGIVHPGLLASLTTNHYATTGTIQTPVEVQDSYGEIRPTSVDDDDWSDLADHVDLPCRIAPLDSFSREQRNQAQLYAVHAWDVAIAGHYPAINETMRFVSDGIKYDIELVQYDGNSKTTHLQVRRVD